jgi:hypothetical protein
VAPGTCLACRRTAQECLQRLASLLIAGACLDLAGSHHRINHTPTWLLMVLIMC